MFTFSHGFEAATLKIPNKESTSYGSGSSANTTRSGFSSGGFGGASDPYNLVTVNSGGVVLDSRDGTTSSWPDDGLFARNESANNNSTANPAPRKQIIGFAKFATRADAIAARDTLQSKRVDVEKGAVLKAEMAKKNLHTKRGVGPVNGPPNPPPPPQPNPPTSVGVPPVVNGNGHHANLGPVNGFGPALHGPPGLSGPNGSLPDSSSIFALGPRDRDLSVLGVGPRGRHDHLDRLDCDFESRDILPVAEQPPRFSGLPTIFNGFNSLSSFHPPSAPSAAAIPRTRSEEIGSEIGNDVATPTATALASGVSGSAGLGGLGPDDPSFANVPRPHSAWRSDIGERDRVSPFHSSQPQPSTENRSQQPSRSESRSAQEDADQTSTSSSYGAVDPDATFIRTDRQQVNVNGEQKSPSAESPTRPPTRSTNSNPRVSPVHQSAAIALSLESIWKREAMSPPGPSPRSRGPAIRPPSSRSTSSSPPQESDNLSQRSQSRALLLGESIGLSPPSTSPSSASGEVGSLESRFAEFSINPNGSITSCNGNTLQREPSPPFPSPGSGTGNTSPDSGPASAASTGSGSTSGKGHNTGADQNPPINTLYVGNLPTPSSSSTNSLLEENLRLAFSRCPGYRKLCFRQKSNGPMCFVEVGSIFYSLMITTVN